MTRVFVSYSNLDRPIAEMLVHDLQKLSVDVWYDQFEVLVGHDIADKVYEGLLSADFVAVVLTRKSVASRWVQEELSFAKQASIARCGRHILPLLFEQCELPPAIRTLKYADFTGAYDRGFAELARALGFVLVDVRPTPLQGTPLGRIADVLAGPSPRAMTRERARRLLAERIEFSVLAVYYTVKNDFASSGSPDPREPEAEDIELLAHDYNQRALWKSVAEAVVALEREPDAEKREAICQQFRQTLPRRMFFGPAGIKHEANLLADVRSALAVLDAFRVPEAA